MSIMDSIDIGAKALRVHGKRIDIHAKNIANVDTPNYVRKIPVLNATEDISFHGVMNAMKEDVFGTGTLPYLQGGVTFNGCVEDPTVGERIYAPGHPDAAFDRGHLRRRDLPRRQHLRGARHGNGEQLRSQQAVRDHERSGEEGA